MKIVDEALQQVYYKALVERDINYEGIFYAGIKTTKIFCHCTCPARKPLYKNVTFYTTTEECLEAGFKACKVCHPLDNPGKTSYLIEYLIKKVNEQPNLKWDENDLKELDIHPNTARRHFKTHYHMTFKQFVRQVRIQKALQEDSKVIAQQVASGYESNSGFNYAIKQLLDTTPKEAAAVTFIALNYIDTPIGTMVSVSDDDFLYLLAFKSGENLEERIQKLLGKDERLILKETRIAKQIKAEIQLYFKGELKIFTTPYKIRSTEFSTNVLTEISKIPYGETRTYAEIAKLFDSSSRAIGRINGLNQFSIIIPCHRLIGSDGSLKGYYGGVSKKQYLLDFEMDHLQAVIIPHP